MEKKDLKSDEAGFSRLRLRNESVDSFYIAGKSGLKMHNTKNNPSANKLGGGITDEKLNIAIIKSGYPLQTRVALALEDQFYVQEEWSFIDDKTKENRNIDLLAEKELFDTTDQRLRVKPKLNLIIECKQSELPYIFFLSNKIHTLRHFPYLAGLRRDEVKLTTHKKALRTFHVSVVEYLGLNFHPFVIKDPIFCNKFSKGERKGDNLLLSGQETFNGIIYPIVKSMNYFKNKETPQGDKTYYFDCHLILGIAVLDAPMVGVIVNHDNHDLVLTPWVRVIRHQTDTIPSLRDKDNFFAIDVVHKDFLNEYIQTHVLPFSKFFAKTILQNQEQLAEKERIVSPRYTELLERVNKDFDA